MLLVKYEDNYADEFDVCGFRIFTPKEWEDFKESIKSSGEIEFPFEWYFGTNEYIDYDSLEDYLSKFKVIGITNGQAKVITDLFKNGMYGYGIFPDIEP